MGKAAAGNAEANGAATATGPADEGRSPAAHAYLTAVADEADAAVDVIEKQLEGTKAALSARKAEAKAARAAAEKGE